MDYQQNSTRTRSTLAPSKSGPGLSVRQGNRVPLGEISANTKSGLENKRPVKSQVITAICFCFASHLNRCRFSPPPSPFLAVWSLPPPSCHAYWERLEKLLLTFKSVARYVFLSVSIINGFKISLNAFK